MARSLFTSPAAPCLKCHMTGNAEHDKNASAPNFLLAHERLQPAWTERWITDPAKIIPGTAMPSGLFRKDGDRWVFAGPGSADRSSTTRAMKRIFWCATCSRSRRRSRPRCSVARRAVVAQNLPGAIRSDEFRS